MTDERGPRARPSPSHGHPSPALARMLAPLVAAMVTFLPTGSSMAATPSSTTTPSVAHCTGRFDYALPPTLRPSGGRQSLYRVSVWHEPQGAAMLPADAWKKHLFAALSTPPASGSVTPAREFELRGVGSAAWLQLPANGPEYVTLLATKSMPEAAESLFFQVDAGTGREALAEDLVGKIAASWIGGTRAGFCTGAGAFVIAPSKNERALDAFAAPGVELTVQTETVAAPDDGQSSDGDPPPGAKVLAKNRRNVGGFDGIEERIELADEAAGHRRVYVWVFPGRPADGAAPRIRLSASAFGTHAAQLDAAWNELLATWRPRPVGVR